MTPKSTSQSFIPSNVQSILAAIETAQRRYRLFPHLVTDPPGTQTVVVGVSGGADSVCLLHALHGLAHAWRLQLHVAHLDHSLRPESLDDARWVATLAQDLGLPYHHARLKPGTLAAGPDSVETAARVARYRFLAQIAHTITQPEQMPAIAVAHHQGDQAETVLLHLIQGSGLEGMAGMTPVSTLDPSLAASPQHPGPPTSSSVSRDVRLIRPLLAVPKEQIIAYLQHHKQPWRDDATNTDLRYVRNRIHQEILPALAQINPNIHATLARNAELAAGEAARVASLDQSALTHALCQTDPESAQPGGKSSPRRLVLNLERFSRFDRATQRGVLRRAIGLFPIETRAVGFEKIEMLLETLADALQPGPHPLVAGLAWTYLPSFADHPPRLSLHHPACLPWLPDFPHLGYTYSDDPQSISMRTSGDSPTLSGHLLRTRRFSVEQLPPGWNEPGRPWRVFTDADRFAEPVITAPRPGMQIAPLGMGGKTKSLGDLFTDAKIPPSLRPGWPILTAQTDADRPEVIWVCGLALSHSVRITSTTCQVCCLAWETAPAP